MTTYAWTVYATQTAIVLAVTGLLGTALFQLFGRIERIGERIDRLADRMDARFEQVDTRFERLEDRMREDKGELLGRMDVLAERITRLESRGGSAA